MTVTKMLSATSVWRRITCVPSQPTASPTATPPAALTTNSSSASPAENVPSTRGHERDPVGDERRRVVDHRLALDEQPHALRARRGARTSPIAETGSVGPTIAPSTNAASQLMPGDDRVRDDGDRDHRGQHEPDRQQRERAHLGRAARAATSTSRPRAAAAAGRRGRRRPARARGRAGRARGRSPARRRRARSGTARAMSVGQPHEDRGGGEQQDQELDVAHGAANSRITRSVPDRSTLRSAPTTTSTGRPTRRWSSSCTATSSARSARRRSRSCGACATGSTGRLRFAFRHFPLREIHPDAAARRRGERGGRRAGRVLADARRALRRRAAQLGLDARGRRRRAGSGSTSSADARRARGRHARARGSSATSRAAARPASPARRRSSSTARRHEGAFDAQSLIAALEAGRSARRSAQLGEQLVAQLAAVDRDGPAGQVDVQRLVDADLELAAVERDASRARRRRAARRRPRRRRRRCPTTASPPRRARRSARGSRPAPVSHQNETLVRLGKRGSCSIAGPSAGEVERVELGSTSATRIAHCGLPIATCWKRAAGDLAGAVLAARRGSARTAAARGPCRRGRSSATEDRRADLARRASGSRTRPGRSSPRGAGRGSPRARRCPTARPPSRRG